MTHDEIIEMAQECRLIGMRPHLDGIYSEALVAFAKLVAEKALAEHAMREVQRLGQEIEQEPVGAVYRCDNRSSISSFDGIRWTSLGLKLPDGALLYTSPPQRKPLTDDLYYELLFAVGNRYPDETRHQTALRYIRQAEMSSSESSSSAHNIKE